MSNGLPTPASSQIWAMRRAAQSFVQNEGIFQLTGRARSRNTSRPFRIRTFGASAVVPVALVPPTVVAIVALAAVFATTNSPFRRLGRLAARRSLAVRPSPVSRPHSLTEIVRARGRGRAGAGVTEGACMSQFGTWGGKVERGWICDGPRRGEGARGRTRDAFRPTVRDRLPPAHAVPATLPLRVSECDAGAFLSLSIPVFAAYRRGCKGGRGTVPGTVRRSPPPWDARHARYKGPACGAGHARRHRRAHGVPWRRQELQRATQTSTNEEGKHNG